MGCWLNIINLSWKSRWTILSFLDILKKITASSLSSLDSWTLFEIEEVLVSILHFEICVSGLEYVVEWGKLKIKRVAWGIMLKILLELVRRRLIDSFCIAWCGRIMSSNVFVTCCWSKELVSSSFTNLMLISTMCIGIPLWWRI